MSYKVKRYHCTKCEKDISAQNFNRHFLSCKGKDTTIKIDKQWLIDENYVCPYCGKKYDSKSNAIGTHIWRMHGDGINHHTKPTYHFKKGYIPWNKGLTQETDARVKKGEDAVRAFYEVHDGWFKGKHHTKETRNKLSKTGGYRPGSGRGKSGWYKGFWCDSSWELAYVIYCLDNHIPIQRNTQKFEYIFEGKKYHYTPDYELSNQRYVEVKGYLNEKWSAKVEQFPYQLTVLGEEEMKPMFHYVQEKYGKNFISLYEGQIRTPKIVKQYSLFCKVCGNEFSSPRKSAMVCSKECNLKYGRIVVRPSKDVLFELLQNHTKVYVAKMYDVSTASINKWVKWYEKYGN